MYNVDDIRADFPVFSKKQETKPFVYLDTAASAQKPQCVLIKYARFTKRPMPTFTAGFMIWPNA